MLNNFGHSLLRFISIRNQTCTRNCRGTCSSDIHVVLSCMFLFGFLTVKELVDQCKSTCKIKLNLSENALCLVVNKDFESTDNTLLC